MVRLRWVILLMFLGCGNSEKDIMIARFQSLHEEVKSGNLDQYYPYLDQASQKMVREFTDPKNMNSDKLRALGETYKIPFWAAEYYRTYSLTITEDPEQSNFFRYLAESRTPLFDYHEDYYLIEEKSRIKNGKNYIVVGRDLGQYRYVEFLNYIMEDGEYKLDLIYMLQLQNTLMARSILDTLKYEKDPVPSDWKNQSIDEVYSAILRVPKPKKASYNKFNRKR